MHWKGLFCERIKHPIVCRNSLVHTRFSYTTYSLSAWVQACLSIGLLRKSGAISSQVVWSALAVPNLCCYYCSLFACIAWPSVRPWRWCVVVPGTSERDFFQSRRQVRHLVFLQLLRQSPAICSEWRLSTPSAVSKNAHLKGWKKTLKQIGRGVVVIPVYNFYKFPGPLVSFY